MYNNLIWFDLIGEGFDDSVNVLNFHTKLWFDCRTIFPRPSYVQSTLFVLIGQGFDDGVDTVWLPSSPAGMHETIKRLYNEEGKNRKLFIAGHSLGGALATIAAARLVYVDDMNIAGMYTIGSPRCGIDTNKREFNYLF